MPKEFSFGVYDRKHLRSLSARLRKVQALLDEAAGRGAAIGSRTGYKDTDRDFSFDDFPTAKREIDALIRELSRSLTVNVQASNGESWGIANRKNDALADHMIAAGGSKIARKAVRKWYNKNERALSAFNRRVAAGMDLSTDVWRLDLFKKELELSLEMGLGRGRSAAELSRDVRSYLRYPDKLFRRVRDEKGVLRLSRAARDFHPGRGVYRSSYKNALRLTATETNMAYRSADSMRWKQMGFVLGIEVRVSHTNHPVTDICDELQGDYPKDFVFTGWHPFCKCFATPKLPDPDAFIEYQNAMLGGEDVSDWQFGGEVDDVPDNFKGWMEENSERIGRAKNVPYFIKENPTYTGTVETAQIRPTITSGTSKRSPLEIAAERHAARTPAQVRDIKARWEKRTEALEARSALADVIQSVAGQQVGSLKVESLAKKLSVEEIIKKLAGGDLTKGSCSSVAFAYAGNRAGFDVSDFRGGMSQHFFSRSMNIMRIARDVGGTVAKHTNDYTKAKELLATAVEGKEYYFTCGSHASIIRKTEKGFEYLEMQSSKENGWKPLDKNVLKWRFKAQKSHTIYRRKIETEDCIIDIDRLGGDYFGFRKMLSYLNTKATEQRKGSAGTIK